MRLWLRLLLIISGILIILIGLAKPVGAAITQPDSISIDDIYVNRNLLETGDILFYATYDIVYGSVPDELVSDTYIFRLIDTDNTTQIAANLPYPFVNNGFGKGIISFYFDAGDAPTFGLNYLIRISGNPSQFSTPPEQSFVINNSDYTSLSSQAGNRNEVRDNVLDIANDLEVTWSVDLLDETDTGTVLSANGEQYFRNSITGIQAMVPELFLVQIEDPDYSTRAWSTAQATTYETRLAGSTIGNAIDAVGTLFSIDFHMIGSLVILAAAIGLIAVSTKKNDSPLSGFLSALAVALLGGVMGWTPMAIIGIMSLLCVIYIGYFLFFARS